MPRLRAKLPNMSIEAKAVLDASALIALLWEEPGSEAVERLLGQAVMSTVNMVEVLQRYHAVGVETAGRQESINALGIVIEEFTAEDAEIAASLWKRTRPAGLSLADRCCIALARRLDLAVHTADREWGNVELGVEVVLIR